MNIISHYYVGTKVAVWFTLLPVPIVSLCKYLHTLSCNSMSPWSSFWSWYKHCHLFTKLPLLKIFKILITASSEHYVFSKNSSEGPCESVAFLKRLQPLHLAHLKISKTMQHISYVLLICTTTVLCEAAIEYVSKYKDIHVTNTIIDI